MVILVLQIRNESYGLMSKVGNFAKSSRIKKGPNVISSNNSPPQRVNNTEIHRNKRQSTLVTVMRFILLYLAA
jgi:hypothetical protein